MSFYRTPTREEVIKGVPSSWVTVDAGEVSIDHYIAVVDWLLRDNVVDRGVKNLHEVGMADDLVGARLAWQMLRTALTGIMTDEAIPTIMTNTLEYPLELAFAEADDAVMFRMRFS